MTCREDRFIDNCSNIYAASCALNSTALRNLAITRSCCRISWFPVHTPSQAFRSNSLIPRWALVIYDATYLAHADTSRTYCISILALQARSICLSYALTRIFQGLLLKILWLFWVRTWWQGYNPLQWFVNLTRIHEMSYLCQYQYSLMNLECCSNASLPGLYPMTHHQHQVVQADKFESLEGEDNGTCTFLDPFLQVCENGDAFGTWWAGLTHLLHVCSLGGSMLCIYRWRKLYLQVNLSAMGSRYPNKHMDVWTGKKWYHFSLWQTYKVQNNGFSIN